MSALWCLSELWIGLHHRAADRSRDDGTLVRRVLVVGGGMVVAMLVSIWLPGAAAPCVAADAAVGRMRTDARRHVAARVVDPRAGRLLHRRRDDCGRSPADPQRAVPMVRHPSYTRRLLTVLGLSVCARQLAGAAGRRGPAVAGLASAHPPRSRSSIRPMRARRGVCCRACGDVASGRRGRPTRAVTPRPGVKLSRPAHNPFA